MTEVHPVAQVFADEDVGPGELRLRYPYWEHAEPISLRRTGFVRRPRCARPKPGLTEHGWDHSLGEIVTALIDAGLRIDFLHEFDFVELARALAGQVGDDGRYRLPPEAKVSCRCSSRSRQVSPPSVGKPASSRSCALGA